MNYTLGTFVSARIVMFCCVWQSFRIGSWLHAIYKLIEYEPNNEISPNGAIENLLQYTIT